MTHSPSRPQLAPASPSARYLRRQKNWLIVTAVTIGIFGPVFFLGTMPATSGPAHFTLDLLSWPLDGGQAFDDPTTRFLSALTGGFLFGWGVTVFCLRQWVFDAAPEGVRRTILVGVSAWFVLDSLGSLTSGTPSNAIINVLVYAVATGPLWQTPPKEDAVVA